MLNYPAVASNSLYSLSQVFLCFLVVIAVIHVSISTFGVQCELPRVFVSASFPPCRNVRMVL